MLFLHVSLVILAMEPPMPSELSIPSRRFDVTKYGGRGDGVTLNTDGERLLKHYP